MKGELGFHVILVVITPSYSFLRASINADLTDIELYLRTVASYFSDHCFVSFQLSLDIRLLSSLLHPHVSFQSRTIQDALAPPQILQPRQRHPAACLGRVVIVTGGNTEPAIAPVNNAHPRCPSPTAGWAEAVGVDGSGDEIARGLTKGFLSVSVSANDETSDSGSGYLCIDILLVY